MYKSLLWKEWRENRLIFFGIILSILSILIFFSLFTGRNGAIWECGYWYLHEYSILYLIVIFSTGLVTNIFVEEKNKHTTKFLSQLPVSRHIVWWLKIASVVILILTVISITQLTFILVDVSGEFIHHAKRFYWGFIYHARLLLPIFMTTLLTSILLKKSILAMLLGIIIPIISGSAYFYLLNNLLSLPHWEVNPIYNISIYIYLGVLFVLAYYLFIRQENYL